MNGIAGVGPATGPTSPVPPYTKSSAFSPAAVASPAFVTVNVTWKLRPVHNGPAGRLRAAASDTADCTSTVFDPATAGLIPNPEFASVPASVVVHVTSPGDAPVNVQVNTAVPKPATSAGITGNGPSTQVTPPGPPIRNAAGVTPSAAACPLFDTVSVSTVPCPVEIRCGPATIRAESTARVCTVTGTVSTPFTSIPAHVLPDADVENVTAPAAVPE